MLNEEDLSAVRGRLDFWMSLAKLKDTYGIPTDLMYVKLDMENRLPTVYSGELGKERSVSSDEFEKGIEQAILVLQVGELDSALAHLRGKTYAK